MDQNKETVAFLGPRASYTHQAALEAFPDTHNDLIPNTTIPDVFHSVQSGNSNYGVVPFENSSNGAVIFTLDLFADLPGHYQDILVCGEVYVDVHHCLVGRPSSTTNTNLDNDSPLASGTATPTADQPTPGEPNAKPVRDIKHVKKLYSHPQAWGQCKNFLNKYLKGVECQDVSSTSRAAEMVSQSREGEGVAAISSVIAAKVFGLEVLAKGIEDRGDNTTRFLILRKRSDSSSTALSEATDGETDTKCYKSLISFTVDHTSPGALADSLAALKKFDLNLTSINSRPSGLAPWNYIFFVEFRGRREEEGEGGAVNEALRELDKVCRGWRWLGSWESKLGH